MGNFIKCQYALWGLTNLKLIADPAGIDSITQKIHCQ